MVEVIEVQVFGDDIDRAIRVLKRQVQRDGILGKLKERERGWKPSIRKKIKPESQNGEGGGGRVDNSLLEENRNVGMEQTMRGVNKKGES
jgi:ribosomal protein S21